MKPKTFAFAGQSFGLASNATYYTQFGIKAFADMNAIVSAFPPAAYLFLPTAAALAVFSFGLNLLSKLKSKQKEGTMSWAMLVVQGLVTLGIVVGTVVAYVLSSFIGILLFSISLGIAALYHLGCSLQHLYHAFHGPKETRREHLYEALDHLLNFIGAASISVGLMLAEVLGLTKIVNLFLFVVNVPIFVKNVYFLIKNGVGTKPEVEKESVSQEEVVPEQPSSNGPPLRFLDGDQTPNPAGNFPAAALEI